MPVPSQGSERSCICMLGVPILLLSTNFILEFRTVNIRQFGIFCFSFCIVIHTSSEWFVAENNVSSRYFKIKFLHRVRISVFPFLFSFLFISICFL